MGKYIITAGLIVILGLAVGFLHYQLAEHTTTYRGPIVLTYEDIDKFENEIRLTGEDPGLIAIIQKTDKRAMIDFNYTVSSNTKFTYGTNTGNETGDNALTIALVTIIITGILAAGGYLLYRRSNGL